MEGAKIMETKRSSRKEALIGLILTIAGAILLYLVMEASRPLTEGKRLIFSFEELAYGCAEGSVLYKLMWFLSDFTECTFMASALSTALMIPAAFLAAHLENKHSPYAGTGVDGNGKKFTAGFITASCSIILSIVLYGRSQWWTENLFIPTFVCLIPSFAMVFLYGKKIGKLITIAVINGIIEFPVCFLIMIKITNPLGLPGFISVSLGLLITVPIIHQIMKRFPWMMKADPQEEKIISRSEKTQDIKHGNLWFFVHRVFGDVGGLMVIGSSWAAIAMYIGAIISWYLNPLHPVYCANNLPMMILTQICTAALSVFIYWPSWKDKGAAFTSPSIIFSSAIVNTYSNSWFIVISSIIIGAAAIPALINKMTKVFKFDGSYPVVSIIQLSISALCIPWSLIVLHLITPLL